MLVLGMLFGVLVAGPLLVLGVLALANNERALAWLDGLRRRVLPSPNDSAPDEAQLADEGAGVSVDASAAMDDTSVP